MWQGRLETTEEPTKMPLATEQYAIDQMKLRGASERRRNA